MNNPIFEIKEEEKKDNYTKFAITPLDKGYGNTLGNSLRRVLLTSLSGSAATGVKIAQVKHQFSTLKGMKEDVVEFVLNLKKVRFAYKGEKQTTVSLNVTGPAEVTAKDIECGPEVSVTNPDQVLAVLEKGAKLDAKIDIMGGTGYSPADERSSGEIGYIPLDAAFSPVIRVNYKVEETRVGRLTNYDKLILEVWTDGTIAPLDAVVSASKTLIGYFDQIVSPQVVEKEEEKEDEGLGPVGNLSVEEVGLPTRVANALIKSGYETVEDLVHAKRDDLVKVRNLGEKSVKIVEKALGERDLEIIG